jgi:hypothetical protein
MADDEHQVMAIFGPGELTIPLKHIHMTVHSIGLVGY